jgi:signal transduction histidine kinase
MKIRNRITYTFTALFGILTISICVIVYLLSSSVTSDLFFNRLNERIKVSEEFFLESDHFSDKQKEEVRKSFLQSLPKEIEHALRLDEFDIPAEIQDKLPKDFKDDLMFNGETQWHHSEEQGMARIYRVADIDYAVIVIASDEYGNTYLSRLAVILLLVSLISVVVIYFLSYYFSKNVLKPIAGKIHKANMISASNLDMRLTVYNKNDELGMLAMSFNSLLDRLQVAFELEKNFVRYASHELKNPLAIIIGEAEVTLMKARTPNEYLQSIEKMSQQAEKLNVLVEHFLNLSKLESTKLSMNRVNLEDLLMDIVFNVSQTYTNQIIFNIDENSESEDFQINADQPLLHNAIKNIIENSCKFSSEASKVYVSLSKKQDLIQISFKDKGIGIPKNQSEQIFKPLYRGANAQEIEGTGIGLALVQRIINLHHGSIEVISELNLGTEFIVSFPIKTAN